MVAVFSGRVVVCDTLTFTQQMDIVGAFKYDDISLGTATSLQYSQLAYVDNKVAFLLSFLQLYFFISPAVLH